MKILAIDPGYERLGIALLEKNKGDRKESLIFSECFKTSSKLPHPKRLHLIGEEIKKIISLYEPDCLALETLFLSTNQKTAMHVSEARGVILFVAGECGIPIHEYSPVQIKLTVSGYGKSKKDEVAKMVKLLVEVPKKIEYDDEMDAIAVGITCFALLHSERLKMTN